MRQQRHADMRASLFSVGTASAKIQIVATCSGLVLDLQAGTFDTDGHARRCHAVVALPIDIAMQLGTALQNAVDAAWGIDDPMLKDPLRDKRPCGREAPSLSICVGGLGHERRGLLAGVGKAMMRIEYRPVPGRTMPFYAVWVTMPKPRAPILAGFVGLGGDSWTARLRRHSGHSMSGWLRRSDAAAWLLIAGALAHRRSVAA